MLNTGRLAGQTIFISGASRGIGKAIALKAAKDGANIVVAAKTAEPHPKLPGTIYTAAEEIKNAGGKCLPCVVDVRDEAQITTAVEEAVKTFGGIDIVINNASAISLTGTLETNMKRYDLMHNINTRGTFLLSKVCLPYLKKAKNPHILNISPPLNMVAHWFKDHVAYTMAKYGMSMCVLGMAAEFKNDSIAVNALWPKTAIHTAAFEMLTGPDSGNYSRKPEIMADAAYAVFIKDSKSISGQFLVDEDVLKAEGITDFSQYAVNPSNLDNLMPDFFLDVPPEMIKKGMVVEETEDEQRILKLFSAIQANLNKSLVEKTNGIFQFIVKGNQENLWYIDLKNGMGNAGRGKPSGSPDATLEMNAKDFFSMFTGQLKPANAFIMGKLKISGNLQKAMKLEKLMGQLKSKI